MPERPQPIPEAAHDVRRADVPAEVRDYADSLERQLDAIVARCGIASFRAAMTIPDAERHARLEAVMDLKDLERYAELIVKIKTAVRNRAVPPSERDWKRKVAEARFEEITREAVEAMGEERVYGPEAAAKAFGLALEAMVVPPVPFSRDELERARKLGDVLILRVDTAADGTPLTIRKMNLSFDSNTEVSWLKDQAFFEKEAPRARWALVSTRIVPNSTELSYFEQTQLIASFLRGDVFDSRSVPQPYLDAIRELDDQRFAIKKYIANGEHGSAAELLEDLKLTNLVRQTPAEAVYDSLVVFARTGKSLVDDEIWTSGRDREGNFVLAKVTEKGALILDRIGFAFDEGLSLGALITRSA